MHKSRIFALCYFVYCAIITQCLSKNHTGYLEELVGIFENSSRIDNATSADVEDFSNIFNVSNNDDGNFLKETTKIVTIKIYPPAVAGKGKSVIRIPPPFGAADVQKKSENAKNSTSSKNGVEEKNAEGVSKKQELFSGAVIPDAKKIDFNLLCPDGPPYVVDGSPLYCTLNSGCPTGYWCHTGSSKSYTFCCPNAQIDNGCNLAVAGGKGDGRMERWYFDAVDSVCKLFIYTGYGGNQNNFLTHQDCVDICGLRLNRPAPSSPSARSNVNNQNNKLPYATNIVSSPFGVVSTAKEKLTTSTVAPTMPSTAATFIQWAVVTTTMAPALAPFPGVAPSNVNWNSIANHADLVQRCRERVGGMASNFDVQQNFETRWYYDYVVDACKSFKFTGFDATANNFVSEYECNHICKNKDTEPQTRTWPQHLIDQHMADPCKMPANSGHGYAPSARWYYDPESEACQQFKYSGQGGNLNNFLDEEQCLIACVLMTPKQQRGDPCVLPKMTGHGSGSLTRFHFNRHTGQCESFLYTGEGGNRNNFLTLQECRLECPESHAPLPVSLQPIQPMELTPPSQPVKPQKTTPEILFSPFATRPVTPVPYYHAATAPPSRAPVRQHTTTTVAPAPYPAYKWEQYKWPEIMYAQKNITAASDAQGTTASTMNSSFPTIIGPANGVHPCKGITLTHYVYCGPFNNYQCSAGYYCHVGSTAMESVCCPTSTEKAVAGTEDICSLPADAGTGAAQLSRWHYNTQTGRCETFTYHGTSGNQNNFLTYELCSAGCEKSQAVNPCSTGLPYKVHDHDVQCSTLQQNVCPDSHYCHVGADVATSVCCPRHGNPCTLAIAIGNGATRLQRWAFNTNLKTCQTFVYTGIGGNENNFITEADCIGSCQANLNPANPCGAGQPAKRNGVEFAYCSTSNMNSCPQNYFCHIGGSPETTLCCPVTGVSPCHLPLSTGSGSSALARWHFDMTSSTCKSFTYTGASGNENNFLSLADCRQVCPEYDNPCPGGKPPFNPATGQIDFCSVYNMWCPPTFWCHLGPDRQTSVCCPFAANPCSMPRVEGTGRHQLPRYYFDHMARQCRTFVYTGAGGNQNNFLSQTECEAACPILDNPCSQGMPAMSDDGNPIYCSTSNQDMCPPTYWCHIGSSATSTLCCPGAGDPCRMPPAKGAGASVFNRWHYNIETKTCVSFTYSGRGGNQNNFLSLTECRATCPEFQNPCSTGQPHISLSGRITRCGQSSTVYCPVTYWCHVGATFETSVCCPGAGDPCELGPAGGNGETDLLRYYYDRRSQTCRQFQYTGMGGNENNFLSLLDCESRCPVFNNPCASGEPYRNAHGQAMTCSVSDLNACPAGYWCHVGVDEQATVCCPSTLGLVAADAEAWSPPCAQPMAKGEGRGILPRFYYESETRQCAPFTYTGVGGNQNNFLSRADCERTCPVFDSPCAQGHPAVGADGQIVFCTAIDPDVCPVNHWCHIGDSKETSVCCPDGNGPCVSPPAVGHGVSAMTRWHYDHTTRRCSTFTYSGLGGNANNFLTAQECRQKCREVENPCPGANASHQDIGPVFCGPARGQSCPSNYWCHVGADEETTVCCPGEAGDACLQSMSPGFGGTKLNRWYFNQHIRQCLPFMYTGVGGNQNNFLSENECAQRCPVFQSPCSAVSNTNEYPINAPVYCSANKRDACPVGFWCHVGVNADTSICCPGSVADLCDLPLAAGIAQNNAQSPALRWYFDTVARQCKQFQYAGFGGNQNNFLTVTECQKKCPTELANPCARGDPYRDPFTGQALSCNPHRPNDCPPQFWCHTGSGAPTCCPRVYVARSEGTGSPTNARCHLPTAFGNGRAQLTRWYYDSDAGQCQRFSYTGSGGNENNFLSRTDCQLTCFEHPNPCGKGVPLRDANGQMAYCSVQNSTGCPSNYYCHVGDSKSNTVCCPAGENMCSMPLEKGRGRGSVQRWHYSHETRQCEVFIYSGMGGNGNNFLTLENCILQCLEMDNPCIGKPYRTAGGHVLYCGVDSVCPNNFFCHYGHDSATTICCPKTGDLCAVPAIVGIGKSQTKRWYYSAVTGSCLPFMYSGLGGNENNFRSELECKSHCAEVQNPCSTGLQPFADDSGNVLRCGDAANASSAFCPPTHFCHIGADAATTVCCPVQGYACELPKKVGTGNMVMQRWYFDSATTRCTLFDYTGIGGNENNFRTETECLKKCVLSTTTSNYKSLRAASNPFSTAPTASVQIAQCLHGEPLLATAGNAFLRCGWEGDKQKFTYCPQTYICVQEASSELEHGYCCPDPKWFCIQPISSGTNLCQEPMKIGPGQRYAYDAQSRTCVAFRFDGCGGNLNNFATLQQCRSACENSDSSFEDLHGNRRKMKKLRSGKQSNSTTQVANATQAISEVNNSGTVASNIFHVILSWLRAHAKRIF